MTQLSTCCAVLLLSGMATVAAAIDQPAETPPQQIGLVEQTDSELTQIDVTVIGPRELAASLTRDDFKLKVNLTKIQNFQVDRFCPEQPESGTTEPNILSQHDAATASYIFYIDQTLLTMTGRRRSIELTEQLIPQLITGGNRGMLISNGTELVVFQHLTTDPQALLDALKRLEYDGRQWDTYGVLEDWRIDHIVNALNDEITAGGVGIAISRARGYQKEEVYRTDKCFRRLSLSLGRLAERPAPKAVIYFADILRANAGEHYLSFFGNRLRQDNVTLNLATTESAMATLAFDQLLQEASALGIRFYSVLGQGLAQSFTTALPTGPSMNSTGANAAGSRQRQKDSENTLANMATETGGYSFINGQDANRIATRIRDDFACFYMLSFDPTGFSKDAPLRVVVNLNRDDLKLRVRGQMVVQSAAARKTARLLRAFTSPEEATSGFEVNVRIIPTGYVDGKFHALLQIAIPGTPLPDATWDLGASMISHAKVQIELAGRIAVNRPGIPVVYEEEISFQPGHYEIISVATEATTGLVSSARIEIDWADPKKQLALVGPIALLQPATGAFLRESVSRKHGSLAHSPNDPIQTGKSTTLVGLLCHGKRSRGGYTIERKLIGESGLDFPTIETDLSDDLCAQIRDNIPANTLGDGEYKYELRATRANELLLENTREFYVAPKIDPVHGNH